MGDESAELRLRRDGRPIPTFAFPEDAARALGHAARYGAWRTSPLGTVVEPADCRPDEATAIVAAALGAGDDWLGPADVERLLGCYGLPLAASRIAATPAEAAQAAREIGGHVALKLIAPGLLHKSELGAVQTDLTAGAVERAAGRMLTRGRQAGLHPDGFLVQAMAAGGAELLVGIVQDPSLGPLIACGAGGVSAELQRDVAVRLTPLTDRDPDEMLRSLRMYPLLCGYRGAPSCDLPALHDLLLRVSALVEAHPQIAEMDLNPVIAGPDGPQIVDARIRLAPASSLDAPPLSVG
jgi:acyl-CoA synthetase (NDP forming)